MAQLTPSSTRKRPHPDDETVVKISATPRPSSLDAGERHSADTAISKIAIFRHSRTERTAYTATKTIRPSPLDSKQRLAANTITKRRSRDHDGPKTSYSARTTKLF